MKHLTVQCDEKIYSGGLFDFYFEGLNIGVLDIETTGLNPAKNKFILGGLFNFTDKKLHQFFAENRAEERDALEHFISEVSKLDMVITYNGKHFDMPFINKRSNIHKLSGCFPYNLDLYLVLNGHSPIKKFVPNLKQKTIENYMGLWQNRTDEISGGESVELYNRYEKSKDPMLEEKILLHNSDDVSQLAKLIQVISKSDFHKAMFHLGFPTGNLTVENIRIERNTLMFGGRQRRINIDYIGFSFGDYPAESRFDKRKSDFYFKLPVIRDSGLVIADIDAAGLPREEFQKYPTYDSGFIVLENHDTKNYMEINHFIKSFINAFTADL